MIDASRLSKCLATALKDRAHGIPVQPNHSLPLRPAPLLPVRKSLISTENVTTSCPNIIAVLSSDREETDDGNDLEKKKKEEEEEEENRKKTKKKKKKKKKGETVICESSEINHRKDEERNEITDRVFIGMNFYDSVSKENDLNEVDGNSDNSGNFVNGVAKDLMKNRSTKSLDGKERGELKLDEKRRKSFEHRTTDYVSSDINKRRRIILNSDEKNNVNDEVYGKNEESNEFLAKKRKSINDDDNFEKGLKILKTVETENRKNKFPDIFRNRVTDKKKFQNVETRDKTIRDKIKITSSIYLKEILHKPYHLPECPDVVPIEIARAINRNDLLKSNKNIIQVNGGDTDLLKKKLIETDDRLIETINDNENEIIEDIDFMSLPSMPILEDSKNDPLSGILTPPKELINDKEDEEDCRSKLIGEAASMLEAEIKKTKIGLNQVDDYDVQESIDRMKILEKHNEEVFEIKIPGRSPELIFLNNGKLLPNEKLCDMIENSPAEAAIPESLAFDVEPAIIDERIKTDDDKNVKFTISLKKKNCEDKLLKSIESLSDDNERRKKSAENVVRQKIIRLNKKLEIFIKEENDLKIELSKTIDGQRINELYPKINCARKRIENIEKHIDTLRSKEKSSFETKRGTVPRIHVRKDLIESISSPILQSEESCSSSSPGSRSISEIDDTSMIKSPPIVITISESDYYSSTEEEETVKTEIKNGETRLEETERRSETVIMENFTPVVPENIVNGVFEIPETITKLNETDKTETIVSKEVDEQRIAIIRKESDQIEVENLLKEPINTNLTSETETSKKNDPILTSINKETPRLFEKNNFQNAQLSIPSFNVCNCKRCLSFAKSQTKNNVTPLTAEINFPSRISNDQTIRNETFMEYNRNVYPVQNYPRDYRTNGNYSRDNGGANSDLSSPLQGHSALPIPQIIYGKNLTAQGYPPPQVPFPENNQNKQLHIQLPVNKSSSVVNIASKQEEIRLRSPILAVHSSTTQVSQELPVNLPHGTKNINSTNGKEIAKGNFVYGEKKDRIITEQFPTLGNWFAEQVSRKPVIVSAVQNLNTTSNQSAVYKPLGSDMYKMTATAVDITHPLSLSETVPSMWRPNLDQQIIATPPGVPDNEKNKTNSYYQRDNQFVNPQNNQPHLPNYQRTLYNMKNVGYSGAEIPAMMMPYAVHPNRQNFQTKNNINVNEYPGVVGGQQKVWQYHHPPMPGIWLTNKNNNNGNPIVVPPQHHLQQLQQLVAPASSSSSSSSSLSSYVKIQPAIGKNMNENQKNNNIIINNNNNNNGKKKKSFDNNSLSYNNSHRENIGLTQTTVYKERDKANLFLPNPTVIHEGSTTYIAVLQNQSVDNVRRSSSGSINFAISYPNQVNNILPPKNYLKCLRCARPAPKFNCSDCEVAFYCNEYCQRSHWMTHSIDCKKKMPKLKKVS